MKAAREAVIVVSLAVASLSPVMLAIATFPTQQTFSGQFVTQGTIGCVFSCPPVTPPAPVTSVTRWLPWGANVTLNWVDVSGGLVRFLIWHAGEEPWTVCGSDGTSGSCYWLSQGGEYTFTAQDRAVQTSQIVNYSGSY